VVSRKEEMMTRATAGLLSVLCLSSGALMVSYSLTAEIEGALDTTPAIMVPALAIEIPSTSPSAPPLAIAASPHRVMQPGYAVRVALAHRQR
jgi:hypothetical protein